MNGDEDYDDTDRPDTSGHHIEEDDIGEDVGSIVRTLRELHPELAVDANEVYALVESERATPDRQKIVIERFVTGRTTAGKVDEAPTQKTADKYDELVNDVDVVRKFVPNKSREEILAYLEAFHANPDRVRIVIDELLEVNGNAGRNIDMELPSLGMDGTASTSNDEATTMEKVNSILEVFPDADPGYLRGFVEKFKNDVNYLNATVSGWLESRSYPKAAEAQKAATKRKFIESDFSVEEFLEMFPDPENYFKNQDRVVSASYKSHVQCYVENQFRHAYKADLTQVIERHRFHLTPIMKEMNALWNISPTDEPLLKKRRETVRKKKTMSALKAMPAQVDELFYKEKLFMEMEERIKRIRKKHHVEN